MEFEKIFDKLNQAIFEDSPDDIINTYESLLSDSIQKISTNENFYELPTESVFRIIKESKTTDIKLLCSIVKSLSSYKSEEAPLVLNFIDSDDGSLDDYIEIISCLKSCPICKRISDITERDKTLPMIDYPGKVRDLESQIREMEATISSLSNQVKDSQIVANQNKKEVSDDNPKKIREMEKLISELKKREPLNFESNIFAAAKKDDVSSIEYLVEQKHSDIYQENWRGNTPLQVAIKEESLSSVKYFVEICHQKITDKTQKTISSSKSSKIKEYFGKSKQIKPSNESIKPIKSFNEDIQYKICCCGFPGAGKTVLVNTFDKGYFVESEGPTIAANSISHTFNIENKRMMVDIWDTSGNRIYAGLHAMYARNSYAIILFYDMTTSETPEELLNEYKECFDSAKPNAIKIFVTTKADLKNDFCHSYDEIKKFAKKNGFIHIKTSSRTGLGVNEVFETAANEIAKGTWE